jgi:molecular chaperone DnaK
LAKDCRSLAHFDLKGIPPMPAGIPRIEVKFLIDANGILHGSAREQRSGKEAEIEVKPTYGLTDEQVETMIMDSFDYAEEDFRQRQVAEARVEADNILMHLDKGKQSAAWQQLTGDERTRIDKFASALKSVKNGDNFHDIRNAIETLNQGTMRLAELMMDSAVSSALKGKKMDEAEVGEGPSAPHPFAPAEIVTGERNKK